MDLYHCKGYVKRLSDGRLEFKVIKENLSCT